MKWGLILNNNELNFTKEDKEILEDIIKKIIKINNESKSPISDTGIKIKKITHKVYNDLMIYYCKYFI